MSKDKKDSSKDSLEDEKKEKDEKETVVKDKVSETEEPVAEEESTPRVDEVDDTQEDLDTKTVLESIKIDFKDKLSFENLEVKFEEGEVVFQESTLNLLSENSSIKEKLSKDIIDTIISEMETVVKSKVIEKSNEKINQIFAEKVDFLYEKVIDLGVETVSDSLKEFEEASTKKIDSFMENFTEEFFAKNYKFLENQVKSEVSENVLKGIFKLLEDNNITLDDTKIDAFQEKSLEVEKVKTDLDNQISENLSLKDKIKLLEKEAVFNESTKELSLSEKDKVSKFLESFKVSDLNEYSSKIESFKKEFLSEGVKPKDNEEVKPMESKIISEGEIVEKSDVKEDIFTKVYNAYKQQMNTQK